MPYSSLRSCLLDLERIGQLVRIDQPVDGYLEAAEMHRQVCQANGPALWFQKIKGSPFTAASNVFSTQNRAEYIFRDSLRKIENLLKLKADPSFFVRSPVKTLMSLVFAANAIPIKSRFVRGVTACECRLEDLPQIHSWPDDGGAFITLPQVITFPPNSRALNHANIGMYRIQISGNEYQKNREAGLHYQLHRGIGIHHLQYKECKRPFRISIGIGGPPALTLASIFPLPEGISEILFSGLLGNRSYRYSWKEGFFIPVDTDFCITGTVDPNRLLPEGPFGDHLGYYSLKHPFPVLNIEKVYHRKHPIFHFTVVGRPPQEDSWFGYLIHEMIKPLTSNEFPGVKEIYAVDETGVHPLLLAIGSERYMPFRDRKPEEILTQANLLLGKGQTSLAKYLIIAAHEENIPPTKKVIQFLCFVLQRIDWRCDLHFITNTTIDTLDYSGHAWNSGSKVIMACNRHPLRSLSADCDLPNNPFIRRYQVFVPGIVVFEVAAFINFQHAKHEIHELDLFLSGQNLAGIALIVLCDDLAFTCANEANFLWVTFTKSNPASDIYGVDSFIHDKHWGCKGPLIIDARKKNHHAPELTVEPSLKRNVTEKLMRNPALKKFIQA